MNLTHFQETAHPSQVIVRTENLLNRLNLYSALTVESLLERGTTPGIILHEVMLRGRRRKLYIDYDMKPFNDKQREQCQRASEHVATHITSRINAELRRIGVTDRHIEARVYSSTNQDKISLHIIWPLLSISDTNISEFMSSLVERSDIVEGVRKFIDMGVYTANKCLRILGQEKGGRLKRVMGAPLDYEPDSSELELSLITMVDPQAFDLDKCLYPSRRPPRTISTVIGEGNPEAEALAQEILEREEGEGVYVKGPVRLNEDGSLSETWTRVRPSKCFICDRVHDHENKGIFIGAHKIVIRCFRAPDDPRSFTIRQRSPATPENAPQDTPHDTAQNTAENTVQDAGQTS
jgi:hypothetical protein